VSAQIAVISQRLRHMVESGSHDLSPGLVKCYPGPVARPLGNISVLSIYKYSQ